jgi:predicted nucleotidyltransferase
MIYRQELVEKIIFSLESEIPDSKASLRGSLAEGHADYFSDIDVRWVIPDVAFEKAAHNLFSILCKVKPVEKIRIDPELALSAKHRLYFVRFTELPLFWRLDLELLAESVKDTPNYGVGNPAVVDFTGWQWEESALANAVAAIKAHNRGQQAQAQQLLQRAYQRLGLEFETAGLKELILQLANAVPQEKEIGMLAERVKSLAEEYL